MSNDKAVLHEKIVSAKLLVIVIDFKSYPSAYCLTQDRCFICSHFWNIYLKIRCTNFKDYLMWC